MHPTQASTQAHADAPSAAEDDLHAFRLEVRVFIAEALPEALRARVERGYDLLTREDHTYWQKQLYQRGWAAPAWPVEYGGTGWSAAQRQVFEDECGRSSCPRTQPQGIKLIGPILYTHGTAAQKQRFLEPILQADEWWCQGYSEPGAGSDLAALSMRAEREGEHYRLNGQKVWTTLAHWADWMFCLVRTDASGRRQEGITFLLVDMNTPGISVRPIKTLDLAHHTNEVFFHDVLVPVGNRIGEEGRGWTYAKALLAHERSGIAELGRARERLERLKRIAASSQINGDQLLRDPAFLAQVGQLEIELMAAEATTLRLLEGEAAPALSSVLKLRGSEITQRLSRLNLDALGPHALRFDLDLAESGPQEDDPLPSFAIGRGVEYLRWRALTVAGGTSEIQRNIIAKLAFWGLTAMDSGLQFRMTEEEHQLRSGVERFVRDHYGLADWRAAAASPDGFRQELWQLMADMGWLAAALPEAYGGLGLGPRARAVLMEGLGSGLVLEPFWSTAVLGAELILAAGSEEQRRELLPQIAGGSLRLAFAALEPGARYQWQQVRCRAERDGESYRLTGRKIAVLDAPSANRLLVLARTDGAAGAREGLSLFCVDAAAAGIKQRAFATLDERRCADIDFDGVLVEAAQRLGAEGLAAEPVEHALDHAMVALCAESVGAMAAVLATTVDYLKTRKQFGRALSEFQALRHRVADMVMATEQTRSLAAMAAMAMDGEPFVRTRAAAAAKVQAGQAGRFVGESAVQLHGGIGVTDELHVGHYLKRLLAIDFLCGDASHHLTRFVALDPALRAA